MSLTGVSYKKTDFPGPSLALMLWGKSTAMLCPALWKDPRIKEPREVSGQLLGRSKVFIQQAVRNRFCQQPCESSWKQILHELSFQVRPQSQPAPLLKSPEKSWARSPQIPYPQKLWYMYCFKSLSLGAICCTIINLWLIASLAFHHPFIPPCKISILTCLQDYVSTYTYIFIEFIHVC